MRAASLLGVLLIAKGLCLLGREVPVSIWTPFAYLWQDLAVALAFLAVDTLARRRPSVGWGLYAVLCVYAAINVPLVRVTSSPLTLSMLRAARLTLADSIAHHVTGSSLFFISIVLLAAGGLPFLLRRIRPRNLWVAAGVALPIVLIGPVASSRIETAGLHRNALVTLLASTRSKIEPGTEHRDWRQSPFPSPPAEDLSFVRGRAEGRNVVLMLLESAGARYLGLHGAAEDPMPSLSRLASNALVFENASAVYPESIKGLFSVLTSVAPAFEARPEAHARLALPSLATVLAGAGYRTGLFHSGRFMYLGMDSIVNASGFDALEDAGHIGGNHDSSFGIDEPSAVKRILAWIDALPAGTRFFVTYLPVAGHHPYETPEKGPFDDREEVGRYRNALHYADKALGQLVEGLRERGLLERTVLALLGDHGEAFHQHEGNYGHTFFVYEENVHVPYLLVLPGIIERQRRVGRPASLLDTAPTILDLLGLQAPSSWQGRSLLEPIPRLSLFFTDYSLGFLGLRDGCWKLIHEVESGRSKLFDVCRDPRETEDLSARFPERVEAYRSHVRGWAEAQKRMIR